LDKIKPKTGLELATKLKEIVDLTVKINVSFHHQGLLFGKNS
jgi:hypothetical protein